MKVTIQVIDEAGNLFAGEAVLQPVNGNGEAQVHNQSRNDERTAGRVKCPAAIERLWKKASFKRELSFQEVKTALTEEGYNFPENTLMMALQSAKFLTRQGGRGNYSWTQKYPFST